jgi:CRP/FNR family transcriptional regulator, cyclic AMP receptor protein
MSNLGSDDAKPLRIQLLQEQKAIQCDGDLARALEAAASHVALAPGEKFISQGAYDDDLYFIIRGSAEIVTNGHKHALRPRGCHVGEMALLDPGSGRSADVLAGPDGAVVLKVSGGQVREIGDHHPTLWRGLARELSERLRGRDSLFVLPNAKPAIFIASSGAAKADLRRVANQLQSVARDVRPWDGPDIFRPSGFVLESLLEQAHCVDFAVIIATPDDLIQKNVNGPKPSPETMTPRDNVMLEFGLFAGALERQRVIVMQKDGVALPSDLQGLTVCRYNSDTELDYETGQIAKLVDTLGPIKRLCKRT